MNGFLDTDIADVLTVAVNSKTSGHSMKLNKHHCSIDATKYYFSNSVVNAWNSSAVTPSEKVQLTLIRSALYALSNEPKTVCFGSLGKFYRFYITT